MKTGINPRRTYLKENERNKHNASSTKCRCGMHSLGIGDMKDKSTKLIRNINEWTADRIRRKRKIEKQIKIRRARKTTKEENEGK